MSPAQALLQPRAGETPLAQDGTPRTPECIRCLINTESGKITQLDDFANFAVLPFKLGQRIVKRQHSARVRVECKLHIIDRDALPSATALGSGEAASPLNEDAPHGFRCGSEEVGPARPLGFGILDQS